MDAGGGGLDGRGAGGALGQIGLETGGLAQRDRKHRPHTVDHIGPEQKRDTQPALLDGHPLGLTRQGGAHPVEQGADATGPNLFHRRRGVAGDGLGVHVGREGAHGVGEDAQLSDLLFDRHPGDQILDPGIMTHPLLQSRAPIPGKRG